MFIVFNIYIIIEVKHGNSHVRYSICSKTISAVLHKNNICPSCSTQLTIMFHEQSPMLPVFQEKSPYMSIMFHDKSLCSQHFSRTNRKFFQHVSMNLQETSTVSTIFPSIFQHVPTIFQSFPFKISTKKCKFSPDFPSRFNRSSTAALSKGAGRVA